MLAATVNLPQHVHAQPWAIIGQSANYVIGQTGFGLNVQAATATGLNQPFEAIVDPATGKVFVCDGNNNRILRYPSTAAMTNGAAAEAVLGQANFTANGSGVSATTLNEPGGIAVDASGNLWVADYSNNRVLRYANAATIASGAAASGVLGQANFTTANIALASSALMNAPLGVFCSGTTLFVTDQNNNRVLRFDNAASLANGGSANAVFGQPDFTTGAPPATPTATNLNTPMQIYVDGADNLWVADYQFNRVLRYPNASTAANGEAATLVFGQTSFGDGLPGVTNGTFNGPTGVYGDGLGNIYVSDNFNNRILIFHNATSLVTGIGATYVMGQTDFVSDGTGDAAAQLNSPEFLFVGTSLLAADGTNNRVLVYVPNMPLPLTLTAFTGTLQDNGQVLLQWQISGMGGGSGGGAGGGAGVGGAPAGTFELEYATSDTSSFNTVLSTQPDEASVDDYSYLQVSPTPGVNYYRLRLIAPDGSSTYSQIVTITVGGGATGLTGLSIYPNPARSSVVVTVPQVGGATSGGATAGTAVAMAGSVEIGIYSSTGMLMQRLVTGAAVNNFDISRLAAGVYTVRVVRATGSTVTGSFVKVN
jgi:hypothetical protein